MGNTVEQVSGSSASPPSLIINTRGQNPSLCSEVSIYEVGQKNQVPLHSQGLEEGRKRGRGRRWSEAVQRRERCPGTQLSKGRGTGPAEQPLPQQITHSGNGLVHPGVLAQGILLVDSTGAGIFWDSGVLGQNVKGTIFVAVVVVVVFFWVAATPTIYSWSGYRFCIRHWRYKMHQKYSGLLRSSQTK